MSSLESNLFLWSDLPMKWSGLDYPAREGGRPRAGRTAAVKHHSGGGSGGAVAEAGGGTVVLSQREYCHTRRRAQTEELYCTLARLYPGSFEALVPVYNHQVCLGGRGSGGERPPRVCLGGRGGYKECQKRLHIEPRGFTEC